MRLDPQVRDVLSAATVTGNRLQLSGQLDRKLYLATAKALELMGGKWSKKERCHLFEDDAGDVVADAISTGAVVDFRKEFQFFETPPGIADLLVRKAGIEPEHSVLEPSAGKGRIIEAIRRISGAVPVACELWDKNREVLSALGVKLIANDFLTLTGAQFDRIVANPPFARGQDRTHVMHMWSLLKPGGRLVSIMSPGWKTGIDRRSVAFRELFDAAHYAGWEPLPDDSFKVSGTGVSTGIVVLDRWERS